MTSTIGRLGILVASSALVSAGMVGGAAADPTCNAANECGIYKLATISEYWGGTAPTDGLVRIDKTEYNSRGGYIAFSQRSTSSAAECVGAVQHFKFSWVFTPDVTTLAGRSGNNLALMSTLWEGDTGNACVDEDPFVWIRSGGRYGQVESEITRGDTFKLSFVNQGGENRVYFKGEGSSSPTIAMNWPLYATGGIEIMPAIRNFGNPMSIVYVYQRQPDDQAPAPTPSSSPSPSVKVSAVLHRGALRVDIDPNEGSGYWTFQIQRQNADGSWTTLVRTYRTLGSEETRTINLRRGVYRVMTQPKYGYGVGYSAPVQLLR